MLEPPWRVAVVDSGIETASRLPVIARRCFVDGGDGVTEAASNGDASGHGTTVAKIIASAPIRLELIAAEVFNSEGRSTPAAVAAAVRWALVQRAGLIHLSLGLRHDRRVLAEAIAQAVSEGVILVASTPARGAPSYPASYPGVIRATGDARCGIEDISHLSTTWADIGGCAFCPATDERVCRGASVGAAYLTRFIVSHAVPSEGAHRVRERLTRFATHHGPERRRIATLRPR
jgi:hypothetical protein